MINQWWQSRSDRERVMIGMGAIAAIIFLSYALIISPISDRIVFLRNQVQEQQDLSNWMSKIEGRILLLRQTGYLQTKTRNEPLTMSIERTLTAKNLSGYLQQVQQRETNQLILHFHQVPFDELIDWLQQLSREYGIVVQQTTVTRTTPMGTVDAMFLLSKH